MNLIVNISPPKCGTTALFHCLARSQKVAKPRIKEPRFFGPSTGRDVGAVPDFLKLDGKYELGLKWFTDLFDPEPSNTFELDFTTYYAVIHETPELIKKDYPDAKFIFVVRDPVDRFISHYYEFAKASISVPAISDAIEGSSDFGKLMYEFSDYSKTYERFAAHFGKDQICVVKFSDLKENPEKVEIKIKTFLDVEDFEFKPTETEKNVSGRAKSQIVQFIVRGPITKAVSRIIPPFARSRLLAVRKKIVLWNTKAVANPELSQLDAKILKEQLSSAYEFYNAA